MTYGLSNFGNCIQAVGVTSLKTLLKIILAKWSDPRSITDN